MPTATAGGTPGSAAIDWDAPVIDVVDLASGESVARLDDDNAHVVARSLLPYSLDLVLTRAVEDRAAGVLEARITGQLDGWSRWTLREHDAGTALRYEQEVTTPGRLMAAASGVARPVLVANHAWMMRGGRRGLLRRGRGPGGSTSR